MAQQAQSGAAGSGIRGNSPWIHQEVLSYPSCARKTEHEEMEMLEWEIQGVSNPKSAFVPFEHWVVAAAQILVSLSITKRWEHIFRGSLAWSVQG